MKNEKRKTGGKLSAIMFLPFIFHFSLFIFHSYSVEYAKHAGVVELVDTSVSKTDALGRTGSIPVFGTKSEISP